MSSFQVDGAGSTPVRLSNIIPVPDRGGVPSAVNGKMRGSTPLGGANSGYHAVGASRFCTAHWKGSTPLYSTNYGVALFMRYEKLDS